MHPTITNIFHASLLLLFIFLPVAELLNSVGVSPLPLSVLIGEVCLGRKNLYLWIVFEISLYGSSMQKLF